MSSHKPADYKADKAAVKDFLAMFYVEDNDADKGKVFTYADQIQALAEREQVAIHISLVDLAQWATESGHTDLVRNIEGNTMRYNQVINDAVDELIQENLERNNATMPVKDSLDAFIYQRMEMGKEAQQRQRDDGNTNANADVRLMYPPQLMRRFEVYLQNGAATPLAVRDVKAEHIGKLVRMRGIVIRSTEVKPLARVVTYTCDTCSNETYQPVTGDSFMPVDKCPSNDCTQSRANGRLMMQIRGSKFVKFQEIRIQEHSDQVPVGSIPRAITVHVEGELTRTSSPGDHVNITGVFLPKVKTGFGAMKQGLLNEVFLQAHNIENLHRDGDEGKEAERPLTDEEMQLISQQNLYNVLSSSIAPEIYGHEDIKKALLLQLVGGVDKAASGMKIRGAINICLMGDPGVAKSQLLGYVDRLAARSQYTTGRGSSGVGLTAAVVKDTLTGEMTLEGGALVLADQGICCIDEFDKMQEQDRTAIHEVMEQQTISIAKAGINTTLNARVSILAAANPAFGRYNPKRSIEQNVDLPAALLSRFDLLWLIQDKPNYDNDLRLAQHITYVHANNKQPTIADKKPLDMKLMRRYIAMCKRRQPVVPEALTSDLVEMYVNIRKEARNDDKNSTFTSPRVLLAVIRISTALARLALRDVVTKDDIEEAMRLTESSKESLRADLKARTKQDTPTSAIYAMARDMYDELPSDDDRSISLDALKRKAEKGGFDEAEVNKMVREYERSNVFMIDTGRLIFL